MKFRTLLLASAAVMVTTSAMAMDITNPFYLPTEGKFLSSTSLEQNRAKADNGVVEGVEKAMYAHEELTYGVTNNFAVVAGIGNTFDYGTDNGSTEKPYNNDHNFDYTLGVKYNYTNGKLLTQAGVAYRTMNPESFVGKANYVDSDTNERWYKELAGYVRVGYEMCCITPYTEFTAVGELDRDNNEQVYSWKLGAYKKWDKLNLDAGVRYTFDETEDTFEPYGDGKNERFDLELAVNYLVTDNFSVGAYASYYLGGDAMDEIDRKDIEYDRTIGLNAKVLF